MQNNIEASITSIENADFKINPKVIKDDYIGCKFCPYNDICYKTYADYVMLEEQKDLEFFKLSLFLFPPYRGYPPYPYYDIQSLYIHLSLNFLKPSLP